MGFDYFALYFGCFDLDHGHFDTILLLEEVLKGIASYQHLDLLF